VSSRRAAAQHMHPAVRVSMPPQSVALALSERGGVDILALFRQRKEEGRLVTFCAPMVRYSKVCVPVPGPRAPSSPSLIVYPLPSSKHMLTMIPHCCCAIITQTHNRNCPMLLFF